MALLAYVPFLHPINALQDWSYLLIIPLAFGISMIYKALRLSDLSHYWRQVVVMTTQIVLTMIGLGIALALLVQVVIPALPIR
ncbi:MAG: hypothetical protein GY715_11620 [Planctomycetes bacterium]|nr:hypothetical protein [Planctomycetota bacterium]